MTDNLTYRRGDAGEAVEDRRSIRRSARTRFCHTRADIARMTGQSGCHAASPVSRPVRCCAANLRCFGSRIDVSLIYAFGDRTEVFVIYAQLFVAWV